MGSGYCCRIARRCHHRRTARRSLYGYDDPYYAYEPGPYGPGPYAYGPRYGGNAVAYCMQRFRSYDPSSGTYVGFDGLRHSCP
jgi:hypothetical protein